MSNYYTVSGVYDLSYPVIDACVVDLLRTFTLNTEDGTPVQLVLSWQPLSAGSAEHRVCDTTGAEILSVIVRLLPELGDRTGTTRDHRKRHAGLATAQAWRTTHTEGKRMTTTTHLMPSPEAPADESVWRKLPSGSACQQTHLSGIFGPPCSQVRSLASRSAHVALSVGRACWGIAGVTIMGPSNEERKTRQGLALPAWHATQA